ncbi:hypothetical protein ACLVWU_15625 [Bdellovibrio sp. HCB290]|uniref:hypothetical protein n=1 Tax=Bdellovibrio sp. HCB290 TaxID=3394356 RepID=UPI0039B5D529
MNKYLRFWLKYSAIFLSTFCLTVFIAIGIVAYLGIDHFHQQAPNDPNLNEVAKISEGYLEEIGTFEELFAQIQGKKLPPFCSTICNPVGLDQDELINGKTDYLVSYYKESGNRALKDPLFRFKLEQMSLVSRTLPSSMRTVMNDILKEDGRETKSKVWLALRLETAILVNLPSLPSRLNSFKEQTEQLEHFRTLIRACHTGGNPKKISSQCEARLHRTSSKQAI